MDKKRKLHDGVYDYVLDWLEVHGIPITRKNYLDLAYGKGQVDATKLLDAECEAALPEELQLGFEWVN